MPFSRIAAVKKRCGLLCAFPDCSCLRKLGEDLMILTSEQMAVIATHGGRATRLQVNMLAGTSNRNALIRKKDGRNVWFPDDYETSLEIEDGDEVELVPPARDIPNGVSSVARMGGDDGEDPPADQMPRLRLVRDLGSEDSTR